MDLSKLKIGFIAGTLGKGGAERQLYYITSTLKEAGASVRVFTLQAGEYWEHRLREHGIPVEFVGQSYAKILRVADITRAVRRHKPDILQSVHFFTNLYTCYAARFNRIHEVGAIRSDVVNEMQGTGGLLGRRSLSTPKVLFANSRIAIQRALEAGVPAERLQYIPNVVDTEYFQPRGERDSGPLTILAAGRLEKAKRFDLLFEAAARVLKVSKAPVRILLAGEGRERQALTECVQRLGLTDAVQFLGLIQDMRPVYATADILMLTSDVEGTPNVLLEAMACGIPVIATDVGGVNAILPGDRDSLVPAGDIEAMTAALSRLVRDARLRRENGAAGRALVLERHAVPGLREILQRLYAFVLSASR